MGRFLEVRTSGENDVVLFGLVGRYDGTHSLLLTSAQREGMRVRNARRFSYTLGSLAI